MKSKILTILYLMISTTIYAQIYSFEDSSVPSNFNVNTGSISISGQKYKLGKQSLQWDWKSGSTLTINQPDGLTSVSTTNSGGFTCWIYNTTISNNKIQFSFYNNSGTEKCKLSFNLNFSGWRYICSRFTEDMEHDRSTLSYMKIFAPQSGNGSLYFDYLEFPKNVAWDRIDNAQYSVNQSYNNIDNFLKSYNAIPLNYSHSASSKQKEALSTIKERIDNWFLNTNNTSTIFNKRKNSINNWIKRAQNNFTSINLTVQSDGSVLGPGLFPQYTSTSIDNENILRFRDTNEKYLIQFALDYRLNHNESSKENYLKILDWYADQGWSCGSALGALRFEKLRSAGYFHSLYLMKDELGDSRFSRELETLKWFSLLGDIYINTDNDASGETADNLRTLAIAKLYCTLMLSDENAQAETLLTLKEYFTNALSPAGGFRGTFKPDFTGYHHRGVYLGAYYPDALYIGCFLFYLLHDTPFELSESIYIQLKNSLLMLRNIAALYDVPATTCGRFPSSNTVLDDLVAAFAYLIESKNGTDNELNAAFGRLWKPEESPIKDRISRSATDICFKTTLGETAICLDAATYVSEEENIHSKSLYLPYAGLFIHRTSDFHLSAKGISKYIWDYECSGSENIYGRYMSYGQIEYTTLTDGNKNHEYENENWNWSYLPGTTTKVLTPDELDYNGEGNDKHRNFSDETFLGGTNMGDTIGIFSMYMHDNTFDPSFYARKTIFSSGSVILCMGSNIKNSDSQHTTVTTLLQQSGEITINDKSPNIPKTVKTPIIIDKQNITYVVTQGSTDFIQNGNLTLAFINHGKAPQSGLYSYFMLPPTSNQELIYKYTNEQTCPISIIQQNAKAHIISDSESGTTAYAIFDETSSISYGKIKRVNRPVIILSQEKNQILNLAICDPDLRRPSSTNIDNLTEEQIKAESQPATVEIEISGIYEYFEEGNNNINIIQKGDNTLLSFDAVEGKTYKINLRPKEWTSVSEDKINSEFQCKYNKQEKRYIIMPKDSTVYSCFLSNIEGKQILSYQHLTGAHSIDMNSLPNGTYIITLKKNQTILNKKIIKQ